MRNKTLFFAVLSVLIPFIDYAAFFALHLFPARLTDPAVYIPLLAGNALGLLFAVFALSRSNVKPTDVSTFMKVSVLLSAVGLFANIVGTEFILANALFPMPLIEPESQTLQS